MSAQSMMATTVDPEGKWLYRVGGLSAFVLVFGYLLTFPVYALVGGGPPSGVEAQLSYFAQHAAGWWAITVLMVFTDLLYVPIFLSLYQALRGINRNAMLLVVAFAGLFVALDLAVTWTAYSALIISGRNYAAATTDAQRAVFVAAASYPSAVLESPLPGIYAIVIPSLGVLMAGLVMLKGVFNRITAYLALATGITGILFVASVVAPSLDVIRIINALIATAWYVFVGIRLYRLGQK